MNKKITGTPVDDIVFIDVLFDKKEDISDYNKKLHEYKAGKRDEEEGDLTNHPLFTVVKAISIAYIKGKTCKIKTLQGEQKSILKAFKNIMLSKSIIHRKVAGWNIASYKLPFIRVRFIEEGMAYDYSMFSFNDSDKKAWMVSKDNIDLIDVVSGASYRSMGLEEACSLCGIEFEHLGKGGSKDVIEERLINTVRLFYCLRGEDVDLEFDVVESSAEEQIEDLPLLKKLNLTKVITSEDAEKVKEVAGKIEDKDKFREILRATVATGTNKEDQPKWDKIDKILEI